MKGLKYLFKKRAMKINNRKKSLKLAEKAAKIIPGTAQLLSKRPEQFAPGAWPTYFKKARGAKVWDLDGNEYLDMSIGGIGANILGYCDPDIDNAVMEAVKAGNSSSLNCPEDVALAELLCQLHPWARKVRYARTGGEAMAIAVRIARAATGREKIAFCGYHGWHDWYLAANLCSDNALDGHLLPGLEPAGVPRSLVGTALPFNYNRLNEIEAIISEHGPELAAIVMEPIRNIEPEPGFLENCIQLAKKNSSVFIFDEISAAFRLTTGGAHLKYTVEPDMAVFSKALGNGYPIAAIIGTSDVMDAALKTFISSTYWTERIGPAAAIATIHKHREKKVSGHLIQMGSAVQNGWKSLSEKHGLEVDVGGIEPLSHFSFRNDDDFLMRTYFVEYMLSKGILASASFYPMYSHTMDHVSIYLDTVDKCFAEMVEAVSRNSLESQIKGKKSSPGFKRLS